MIVIDKRGRQVQIKDRSKTAAREETSGGLTVAGFIGVLFALVLVGLWLLQYLPFSIWPAWMV